MTGGFFALFSAEKYLMIFTLWECMQFLSEGLLVFIQTKNMLNNQTMMETFYSHGGEEVDEDEEDPFGTPAKTHSQKYGGGDHHGHSHGGEDHHGHSHGGDDHGHSHGGQHGHSHGRSSFQKTNPFDRGTLANMIEFFGFSKIDWRRTFGREQEFLL